MLVTAPKRVDNLGNKVTIFLAGSIEMGNAEKWQEKICNKLDGEFGDDIIVFNPRRDDWDSSWKQTIEDKNFKSQVIWEQDYLLSADIVFFFIQGGTLSPITLLEFGQVSDISNIVMCCEKDFWRRGNIEVVCSSCNPEIQVHANIDEAYLELTELISEIKNARQEDSLG